MKSEDFVEQIRKRMVDDAAIRYKRIIELPLDQVKDPYWKRAIACYESLDSSGKDAILEIMRQVAIDTVADLFAIIDGVSSIPGQSGKFGLSCGPDQLEGYLTDEFLVLFEEDS